MLLHKEIVAVTQQAIQNTYNTGLTAEKICLQTTRQEFDGSHTIVTFSLVPYLQDEPLTIANQLGQWLVTHIQWIASYQAVKGFLNLTIADQKWMELLDQHSASRFSNDRNKKKVLIEISSPNTNKPLHLGHLRNIFIGDAVANILEAVGYQPYKIQIINDRGIHICKSMVAYQQFARGATPADKHMKSDHFVGHYYVAFEQAYQKEVKQLISQFGDVEKAKQEAPMMQEVQHMLRLWEEGDQATRDLWSTMNQWVYQGFHETYTRIGIHFDKSYYESNTYLLGKKIVREGLASGLFYQESDRSVWVNLEEEGLGRKLLLRSDGTSVYMTQDLGTAHLRYQDFAFDKAIYVVGDEQNRHFQVLFAILKKLGKTYSTNLFHLSYGMVDLPTGKMKSREGNVVDADQLMDKMIQLSAHHTKRLGKSTDLTHQKASQLYEKIGMAALKYFLLKVNPSKRILFDPQSSIDFQGDTGPFIQYTYARICSLLKRGHIHEVKKANNSQHELKLNNLERELIIILLNFPATLSEAAHTLNPAIVANYIYQLCKAYSRLYAALPILKESDSLCRLLRLRLSQRTADMIKKAMQLLNIAVPEQM
ncbi:MAG: arginine--tRNA ligase [Bacteroidota bacterium]